MATINGVVSIARRRVRLHAGEDTNAYQPASSMDEDFRLSLHLIQLGFTME